MFTKLTKKRPFQLKEFLFGLKRQRVKWEHEKSVDSFGSIRIILAVNRKIHLSFIYVSFFPWPDANIFVGRPPPTQDIAAVLFTSYPQPSDHNANLVLISSTIIAQHLFLACFTSQNLKILSTLTVLFQISLLRNLLEKVVTN